MESDGRVVVITGASAGVGRAIAHRFAREAARIGLIARDADALDLVAGEVSEHGGKALVLPADVADSEALFSAAEEVRRTWGGVDVWVNDAMTTVFSPLWEIEPEEFRRVTEVDYLGFVWGTMAALRLMRPAGHGTIIQVGSALAYRGIPQQSAYCGAKHAIRGFTDSLRAELLHERSKVRLSIVELPAMNTPQFDWARTHMKRTPRPMGEIFEPEAAAEAVWLASRAPLREYWLGRTTLLTILGNLVLPSFLDRFLAKSAWEGQETPQPALPDRPDNLFAPVRGLHRTRGAFSLEAQRSAIALPGPAVRLGVISLGAAAAFALGLLAGTARTALRLKNARRRRA
ncbi:MAG: SDR family oxidoreductase [Caulobacteraceae bacterium]